VNASLISGLSGPSGIVAAPEPSTWALMLGGLACWLFGIAASSTLKSRRSFFCHVPIWLHAGWGFCCLRLSDCGCKLFRTVVPQPHTIYVAASIGFTAWLWSNSKAIRCPATCSCSPTDEGTGSRCFIGTARVMDLCQEIGERPFHMASE